MSRKNRPLLSLRGEPNVPTTEHTARPPAEPNAPIQEKTMEASQDKPAAVIEETSAPASPAPIEPTAKEMALAEERNAARAKAIIDKQQAELGEAAKPEPVSIIGLAAQGMDVLHDAIRQHRAQAAAPEYTPPPRTPRQMAQLEAELEAGRKAQQRAAEQQALRPPPAKDPNEGFTTPVHRPGDVVPDPTVPAAGGFAAGQRQFGADAP